MSAYDPRENGAACDTCWLNKNRDGDPVPPERHDRAGAIIVAEAPGLMEIQQLRPLCGDSGVETMAAVSALGYSREAFHWSNAILCRPPGNDMEKALHAHQADNKIRKQKGEPQWPTPQHACRPRLMRELQSMAFPTAGPDGAPERLLNVIAMGKHAWNSIAQAADSIGQVRGGPAEKWIDSSNAAWDQRWPATDGHDPSYQPMHLRIMPVNHAAFVLRSPKWRPAFRGDFGRAVRWWTGRRSWVTPSISLTNPSARELRNWLETRIAAGEPFFGVDLETDSKEPLTAQIRMLGICDARGDNAVRVHFLSKDGHTRFYTDDEQLEVQQVCIEFLTSERVKKVGHNWGYFDDMCLHARWGIRSRNFIDTILIARLADSEMPKSLAYIASVHTDAPSWKKDKKALTAETDDELGGYCVSDVAADVRALPGIADAMHRNQQGHLLSIMAKNQKLCVGMHENGMFVDEAKRREFDVKLTRQSVSWLRWCRKMSGRPDLNPNSTAQLRDLIFKDWAITAEEFTKLGDPSTGDEVLRRMLKQNSTLTRGQKLFVKAVRKFRKASKQKGTFVHPLRPSSEFAAWDITAFNEDDLYEETEQVDGKPLEWDPRSEFERDRERKKEKKPGLTLPDGRVHPDFNAHGTTSMRLSSSNPNGQNFVKWLREMIRAQAGRILIGADQGQLELRVAAALWRCVRYLEAFVRGGDPHLVTCRMIYGEDFETKFGPDMREKLRAFAKRFSYAVLYGASLETVHDTLTSSEDFKGNLMFPDLSIRETRRAMSAWLGANPEIQQGWDSEVAFFRQHGYLEEPVLGHRRFFRDGEDRNELLNFRCQSSGSAIVHLATHRLVEEFIPFQKWGTGTGLIQQGHDSLVVEVPIEFKDYTMNALKVCMAQPVKAFPGVPFTGDAKAGMTWNKV